MPAERRPRSGRTSSRGAISSPATGSTSAYTEEYGIERLHRDAHGWAIAGGTPTIQRIRIVSELLGRRFDQRR